MKSENIYENAKYLFIDSKNPRDFIKFESSIAYLEKLLTLSKKPFKFIILYGEPGIGKTMLLHTFAAKASDEILLYDRPFFTKEDLKKRLCNDLFEKESDLFAALERSERQRTVILDEVQLYDEKTLEFVRIVADSEKVRFILSLHSDPKMKNILLKEHFKTRTLQSIQMLPPTPKELHIYIQKKLFKAHFSELAKNFHFPLVRSIYRWTEGNFRKTNQLLYQFFDILDYYDKHHPTKLQKRGFAKKFLEMSAIYLGYIDA